MQNFHFCDSYFHMCKFPGGLFKVSVFLQPIEPYKCPTTPCAITCHFRGDILSDSGQATFFKLYCCWWKCQIYKLARQVKYSIFWGHDKKVDGFTVIMQAKDDERFQDDNCSNAASIKVNTGLILRQNATRSSFAYKASHNKSRSSTHQWSCNVLKVEAT